MDSTPPREHTLALLASPDCERSSVRPVRIGPGKADPAPGPLTSLGTVSTVTRHHLSRTMRCFC